jgi:L-alanine-DL-glutamate epimerase-like enolase superfamily enzyme
VARVETVRDAIGPDAALFVDANQAWTVAEAIKAANALSEFDVDWVEEPVSEFDESGVRRVADAIVPAVAGGEMFYRPERFHRLLESGGIAVAQPDLIRAGGISGMLDVATLADRAGVPLAPHIYYPIAAHVVAAVSNGWLVEYIPEYDVTDVVENAPAVRDGRVVLPSDPGHGYRISSEVRAEYEI